MPYVIVAVVLIIASLVFFALQTPAEAPAPPTDYVRPELPAPGEAPEGFVEPTEPPPGTGSPEVDEAAAAASADKGGDTTVQERTVSADASYFTPRRTEHAIAVTLTLDGTTITAADVSYDGGAAVTPQHSAFDAAYESVVIGQDINQISLSRVGGASLTSDAFNQAVAEIRARL